MSKIVKLTVNVKAPDDFEEKEIASLLNVVIQTGFQHIEDEVTNWQSEDADWNTIVNEKIEVSVPLEEE